jgi:hypothetical protein
VNGRAIAAAAVVFGMPLLIVLLAAATSGTGSPASAAGAAAQAASSGPVAGGKSAAANEALGKKLAAAAGWPSQAQDACLNELWTRESGWSNVAKNQQSGAYGISQALGHLPGENNPTAAQVALNEAGYNYPDTAANPADITGSAAGRPYAGDSDPASQITWGLSYIKSAYGSPCGAWAHEEQDGWY